MGAQFKVKVIGVRWKAGRMMGADSKPTNNTLKITCQPIMADGTLVADPKAAGVFNRNFPKKRPNGALEGPTVAETTAQRYAGYLGLDRPFTPPDAEKLVGMVAYATEGSYALEDGTVVEGLVGLDFETTDPTTIEL